MARAMRGGTTLLSQLEGEEEPEMNLCVPQQKEQPDATKGEDIVDQNQTMRVHNWKIN